MSNIAVLGAVWGDEGKGRIVHDFSKDYDWIIRFNGGANAGHTIYRDGKKYVHNLLPSIDWRSPRPKAYLGAGMVIDLDKLLDEAVKAEADFPGAAKRIYVDKNAFIVEEKHKEADKAQNAHIGSTNRGIGPAYADKISRRGTRVSDLIVTDLIVTEFFHDPCDTSIIKKLSNLGVNFVDLLTIKKDMVKADLLYEGAQGVLLDINHGIYPYVSSSDCTVGGIYASGFAFAPPTQVYGVFKCYTTKVGEGPFPTEIFDEEATKLRELGKEYGATTGRARRIGWLDLPALKYACEVSGITHLIITKLDIVAGMDIIPVCTKYDKPVVSPNNFFSAKPLYTDFSCWKSVERKANGTEAPNFELEILDFLETIEKYTQRKMEYVSCGTEPQDIINLSTITSVHT